MIFALRSLMALLLSGAGGCAPHADHAHGPEGHDHGGAHHAEDEGVSWAITRWADGHELFVELDAPVAGAAFTYHAHVTRLADNRPATSGTLTLRFEQGGQPAASHQDDAVARPGIFAASATAPGAGEYDLVFTYASGEDRAVWDAGRVTVGASEPAPGEAEPEGEIAFLKESQWQIPFRVRPAALGSVAPVVAASGVVRPAPGATAVVAAPADGLLIGAGDLPVVGRRVQRGDPLALLLPVGAAERWSTLQGEIRAAAVDRDLAASELRRVEGLTSGALVSTRRLDEARAAFSKAEARWVAAQRRTSALSSGDVGAIPVDAPATGLLVALGAAHGEVVHAGDPLVTVSTGEAVIIEARVFSRARPLLRPVSSLTVTRAGGGPLDLFARGGEVLTERLVYDPATLSAPLVITAPEGSGLEPGDLVEVEVGVGGGPPRLTVPRSAVVEIHGREVVFVQKTGESFTRRRVVLGDRDAAWVVVTDGLVEGEQVVVEGGFDVHVASLSGTLESHQH